MSLGYGSNPYSNWRFIALSQFSVIFISALISFFPQYYILGYIIYLAISLSLTSLLTFRSNPMLRERKYMGEIMKSKTIYEEKNAREMMNKDEEYMKIYKQMLKRNGYSMLYLVGYLVVVLIIYDVVFDRYRTMFGSNHLDLFLAFFLSLDAVVLANIFISRKFLKGATSQVMAPQAYRITEKGVIASDATGVFLHSRHLPSSDINVNREKRYVEIRSNTIKLPYDIRLYTRDIDKLLDVLERVKRLELRRQQSSSQN